MDVFSAVVLGVIQGLTEFLPVSSSGHLVLGQRLLGWKEPEIFLDICLHVGTFAAVLLVFREDVRGLVRGGWSFVFRGGFLRRKDMQEEERTFLLVCVATLPVVALGLLVREQLEMLFASVTAVSVNLILTGFILWSTRLAPTPRGRPSRRTSWRDALLVGLAQGLSLAPGISRSGSTISVGLLLGLDRQWAARFSFLLFVPAVLGALVLELARLEAARVEIAPVLLGAFTAMVTGYVALRLLLQTVRRGSFCWFAPYCWAMGIAGILWASLGGA